MKKKPRRKTKDLNSSEREYRLLCGLMDNIPDVVYFKDRAGRLLLVNQAHARGLGLKPAQVVGKTDFDFFPKERAELMRRDDEKVMRSGQPIIDKIERSTRADGVDNYVSTTKIPRFDAKGKVIGLIGITRDITRRMRFEGANKEKQALEKKLEALEELNKLKSEFVSIVSHELRTPLAIIKEASGLIFDGLAGPVNDQQKGLLKKAQENIIRLSRIIEELLEVSRIEAKRVKLHYSLIDLNELLKDSAEFFLRQAKDKGIKLSYSLPDKEVNIFLDAERINQVLNNLLANAVKFTEAPGNIKVELKELEGKVRIAVIDTGIGIAKNELSKLFHKFTQLSGRLDCEKKGLGLGLSIAKELVLMHGGEIWAESKAGVGSKFFFTLPRVYSVSYLKRGARESVNSELAQGKAAHLVSLHIINYKLFRQRVRIGSEKMLRGLEDIIKEALGQLRLPAAAKHQVACNNTFYPECSIIISGCAQKDVQSFCALLKNKIDAYLSENKKGEDVAIVLGMLSYPQDTFSPEASYILPAQIQFRQIFIGAERRRHKRANCSLDVNMLVSQDETQACHSVDLSEGGLCFICNAPLKTDARLGVKLKLPGKGQLHLTGRVAWIKEIDKAVSAGKQARYKAGLEFINLKAKDKKILKGFLRAQSFLAAKKAGNHA